MIVYYHITFSHFPVRSACKPVFSFHSEVANIPLILIKCATNRFQRRPMIPRSRLLLRDAISRMMLQAMRRTQRATRVGASRILSNNDTEDSRSRALVWSPCNVRRTSNGNVRRVTSRPGDSAEQIKAAIPGRSSPIETYRTERAV